MVDKLARDPSRTINLSVKTLKKLAIVSEYLEDGIPMKDAFGRGESEGEFIAALIEFAVLMHTPYEKPAPQEDPRLPHSVLRQILEYMDGGRGINSSGIAYAIMSDGTIGTNTNTYPGECIDRFFRTLIEKELNGERT